jgi:transposase
MFKTIPKEIRDQVLSRVKNDGITANQAANDAGISPKTVYGWLSRESKTTNCDQLALARVKRERQGLYEIIGKLTVAVEKSKRGRL